MIDFADLMEENECRNCGQNGYACRCTAKELREAEEEEINEAKNEAKKRRTNARRND